MPVTGNPYADTRDMYAVHIMFRREFGLLPGLVRFVPAKDEERARTVTDHIRLMCGWLHHHHTAEDQVLWPLLLARAPKEIDPVVRLAEGHHANIDRLLTEVEARVTAWTGGAASDDGEKLAATLQRLAAALYEHMGLEEQLVLPLAERHVFAAEWQQMAAQAESAITPEVGPVAAGMVMYESGPDILPPGMRDVLADVAPQAYAAYCQRVHGTAAPPKAAELVIGTPFVGVAGPRD